MRKVQDRALLFIGIKNFNHKTWTYSKIGCYTAVWDLLPVFFASLGKYFSGFSTRFAPICDEQRGFARVG